MKNTYVLKEILKSNYYGIKSFAIIIEEQPSNILYFSSDSSYLANLVNKYNKNKYISVTSGLERIGIKLNILREIYGEDFNNLTSARLFSQMYDLNMLAGNMCLKKFNKILKNLVFKENDTGNIIDINNIFN